MNDLGLHVLLFLVTGLVIVAIGTTFGEPRDREAVRAFPRRYLYFVIGCGVVVAVMLLVEHTVASVD